MHVGEGAICLRYCVHSLSRDQLCSREGETHMRIRSMTQEVEGEIQTGRLRTDHCLLYVHSQSYEPSLLWKERWI